MRNSAIGLAIACLLSCAAVAQTPSTNSTEKLQSKLSQFAGWLGEWQCDGKFVKSGKSISSTIRFASTLQGRWIEMHQDDLPPNHFHAIEYWGYDDQAGKFTATVFDNFNQTSRFFEAKPVGNGVLTWSRDIAAGPTSAEQFLFENTDSKLKITYQLMKDGSWVVGDVLICARQ